MRQSRLIKFQKLFILLAQQITTTTTHTDTQLSQNKKFSLDNNLLHNAAYANSILSLKKSSLRQLPNL